MNDQAYAAYDRLSETAREAAKSELGAYTICNTLSSVNQIAPPCSTNDTKVKECYRKIALKTHPDKNPNDPIAEERFKDVARAYQHTQQADQDKKCSAIKKPETLQPPPSASPSMRPPTDPYTEAYESTQRTAPPNCTFEEFKAIFIAKLLPKLLMFCFIVVAVYGSRLTYSSGPTHPPGFKNAGFGGGKTRGKKSNNRPPSVGGGKEGDTNGGGDNFFPATPEFLGRDVIVDVEINHEGDLIFHDAHEYIEGGDEEEEEEEEEEFYDANDSIPEQH